MSSAVRSQGHRHVEAAAEAAAQAACDSILSRVDAVVKRMVDRILEEEPIYRDLAPEDLADVVELANSNSRLMARALGGHRITVEQLDFVAEHVRARMAKNIPLEAVLQAYRTAMNAFWEECTAEVASRGLARDTAVSLARRMSEATDTLTTHVAAVYIREESHVRAAGERAARDMLDAILRGDIDPERAEPYGAAPGLDPQGDLVVIVGRVLVDGGPSQALEAARLALVDAFSTRKSSPLVVVRDRAVVAVVGADGLEEQIRRAEGACQALSRESETVLVCGVSSLFQGFGHAPAGFEQASLAVMRASPRRPVVSLETLPTIQHLLLSASAPTRLQIAAKASVLTHQSDNVQTMIRDTVRGYAAANMNVTRAATGLHIHENTVRYRLRRIRDMTGYDAMCFGDLFELTCLLEAIDAAPVKTGH
jgi:hypothetical protein